MAAHALQRAITSAAPAGSTPGEELRWAAKKGDAVIVNKLLLTRQAKGLDVNDADAASYRHHS